jgi:hypothetical protein
MLLMLRGTAKAEYGKLVSWSRQSSNFSARLPWLLLVRTCFFLTITVSSSYGNFIALENEME